MAQTLKTKIEKNIPWLDGYQKGKDAQDIKNGAQGILSMMEPDDISKFNDDLLKYMSHAEKFKEKFEKSEDLKIKDTFETFQKIEKLYEDSNQKQTSQESTKEEHTTRKEPSKVVEKPINKTKTVAKKHEQSIKTSNHDMQNMNNSFQQLSAQIQALGNSAKSNEMQTINKKLDSLKADLSFEIKQQFDKRKETYDEIDMLPAKLDGLSKQVDSINISSTSSTSTSLEMPKDEQAIIDLTKYMKEGLNQFENIAKYYITKQSEFDKLDKINQGNQDAFTKSEEVGYKAGEVSEKIRLATEIFSKFPEKFNDIKSVFEDIIIEEYEVNQEIDITHDNRQECEIKIKGIKTESKITIKSPAILIGGKIVEQATIKESN
ncbi:MAG: hypothetical protein DRG78_22255 [Epsilonproteobacteria bacterium]|nr:MAG: hypothetical protein DRG78_22255 [Campylobacterota bacterium]